MDSLAKFGATPQSVRYVRDGKLITAAGISAGIDMALFLAGLVVDESYTRMLQLVIEYFPQPPVNLPGATAVPVKTREDAAAFLKSEMMKMGQEWLG
jgi:transcriptional regulator GlxA family with amidase domain